MFTPLKLNSQKSFHFQHNNSFLGIFTNKRERFISRNISRLNIRESLILKFGAKQKWFFC